MCFFFFFFKSVVSGFVMKWPDVHHSLTLFNRGPLKDLQFIVNGVVYSISAGNGAEMSRLRECCFTDGDSLFFMLWRKKNDNESLNRDKEKKSSRGGGIKSVEL